MENRMSIDLDLERRNFEASGICTKSMFENVMWDQWQFKYVPLVREKKICDNAIKINDRFLGWKAAKATPEGFVLMPKQPTPKMIDATWNFDEEIQDMSHNSRNEFIYNAMIAAAQEPTND